MTLIDWFFLSGIMALLTIAFLIVMVQVAKWAVREMRPRPAPQPPARLKKSPSEQCTYDVASATAADFKIVYTGKGFTEGMPVFVTISSRTGPAVRYWRDPLTFTPCVED